MRVKEIQFLSLGSLQSDTEAKVFFFLYFLLYLFFLRLREREGDRGSEVVSAESPVWGSISGTASYDLSQIWCLTDWATQAPLLFCFFKCFYFWERMRAWAWVGEGQREKGCTEDSEWALCWQLWHWQQLAGCGAWTHKPWDDDLIRSWTLNHLSHSDAPEVKL